MRSLCLLSERSISIVESDLPDLLPGDLLLEVKSATTCGTDLKAFQRGHPQIPMPGPFGHEYSGTVIATGNDAKFQIGDDVMGVHTAPCQHCRWCLRDQENLCETIMATKVLGSFGSHLRIPKRISDLNVFLKPAQLSFDEACLLEPLSCVAQGILNAKWRPDDEILIIGPGAIGLMFGVALRSIGTKNVTLVGRNPKRLKVANHLDIPSKLIQDLDDKAKFDVVVECTGNKQIWESSIERTQRGGVLMLFGGLPSNTKVEFNSSRMHYEQITILSPFHFGTKAVKQAHDWLLLPDFDLKPLLSGQRTLDQAIATFQDLEAGNGVKYVFKP